MKALLTTITITLLTFGVLILGYGVANWVVFLNIIEEPLQESEEVIPDLGIVENTNLDEEN